MTPVSNGGSAPLAARFDAWEIAVRAPDCHPFQVGAQVLLDGGDDLDFLVALLHDSLEDDYADRDEIALKFGTAIRDLVEDLTRDDSETYAEYIERIVASGPIVRKVKLADIYVNLQRSQRDGRDSLVKRYQRAFNRVAEVAYGL